MAQPKLTEHRAGCLVISHNRTLLGEMDAIFELTEKGLHEYGEIMRYTIPKNLKLPQLMHKVNA